MLVILTIFLDRSLINFDWTKGICIIFEPVLLDSSEKEVLNSYDTKKN